MRIASIENENGVSGLINSHFDKNEVIVEKIESMDEDIYCGSYPQGLGHRYYNP